MKTLSIENLIVDEIIIRPNEEVPVSMIYRLVDDKGENLIARRAVISKSDLPGNSLSSLTNLVNKIVDALKIKEGL